MGQPLVIVEDLHKTFVHMGRELNVLRGIELVIDQGDVVAIVGASGAGKSTFLHCIGTLDIPTRGRIRLGSDELTGLSGSRLAAIRNRTIGFVFQFHHLLPEFNALENVMMPGLIQGKSRREMEGPAKALLTEVGLIERVTHRPGELSGGEQQRVALARALVLSPKLILADEPTGNLDSATSHAMHELFFEINRKHGTTIVVVTHNQGFAQSMPRVVTMKDGRVDTDHRRPVRSGPAAAPVEPIAAVVEAPAAAVEAPAAAVEVPAASVPEIPQA
jgi:lipoprotein-releasing system ATP-binding protein